MTQKLNVQQGDLAYITAGPEIGLIVEVVRYIGHVRDSNNDGPHWHVRAPKKVQCYREQTGFGMSAEFIMPDDQLRPIAGDRFASDTSETIDTPREVTNE